MITLVYRSIKRANFLNKFCTAHLPPLYYQYIHNKWRWNDKEHYHCNANDKEWEETGSIAGLSSIIQEYLHGMGMGIETHEHFHISLLYMHNT